MKNISIVTLLFLFFTASLSGQSNYEKAWNYLDNTDVENAIKHFDLALKDASTKEQALLCLTMLYAHRNKEEKASRCFNQFLDISDNPYPELYALWFTNGVTGYEGKKRPFHEKLLHRIEQRKDIKGKLDAATMYRLLTHHNFSFDKDKANSYFKKLHNVEEWQLLGPFDNVMNSGYHKDYGVLSNPEKNAKFTSRYGAEIQWFNPPQHSIDGYLFKDMFFRSTNSLIYAQTFIETPSDQEVIIKFGYSGSLKVWINDELLYQDPERRMTEMDYFRYKVKLNSGYNRILVQLGDYEEDYCNFIFRITDADDNPLDLPFDTNHQPYKKGVSNAVRIPYFAVEALKKKAEASNDLLYQILLVEAYVRSLELDKAEEILKQTQIEHPNNYFVVRNLVTVASKGNNRTNQNKYYDEFEEKYKHDKFVLENKIEEAEDKKDNQKVKELIDTYLEKYSNPFHKLKFELTKARIDEDNDKLIAIVNKMYKEFPDDSYSVFNKYNLEKSYFSEPVKANKILTKFLKENYHYDGLSALAKNYFEEGNIEKAIELLEKSIEISPSSIETYRNIVNLLVRQRKYDEAIKVCDDLLENRPSDYLLLEDLAVLYTYKNDKKKAIDYYDQALEHFPFSFETNEKIRELKGLTKAIDLVPETDPSEIIKDFEKKFVPQKKESYDVVFESYSKIVYQTKAKGNIHKYLLRLNDEKAIEQWQKINFAAESYMRLYLCFLF